MGDRPAPAGGPPSSIGTDHAHATGEAPGPAPQTPRRTAHPNLIRRNPRLFHQLGPLRLVAAYEARELLGRVARGIGSEAEHFLAHFALGEHAVRVGGELRHRPL